MNNDPIPLECLRVESMASGDLSLRLTECIGWEDFPGYAETVVGWLGGVIAARADSAAERVWDVRIQGQRFWLALDDFGLGVSLDSQDAEASIRIECIRRDLLRRAAG
jgi:hypothetical protein